jgi:hypothetical protein
MPTCPNCAITILYPRPNCPTCWTALDLPPTSTPATRRRSVPGSHQHWLFAGVVVVAIVAIVGAATVLPSSDASHNLGLPPGGQPAQPAADPVLAAAGARHIAREWFKQRDDARYKNDNAALGRVETGTALAVDKAFTRQINCGCEPLRHQHTVQSVHVVVPNPKSLTFLAQFAVTASNGVHGEYTVVLTFGSGVWKAPLLALDEDRPTIQARAHAKPSEALGRGSAVHAAAAYLLHWLHVGSAPRSGATWTGNAEFAGRAWAALGGGKVDPHTGVRRTNYTAVSHAPAYTFPIAGGTLTCGVIDSADTASVPFGKLLQSPNRHQWGPTIAPGTYPTLREATTLETCVVSRPHHVRELISTYGEQTGISPGSQPAV